MTEDEDEYAPLPLDSQQSVYHEETLNIAQKQALTTLAGTHVMYHSRQHRFNSLLHMSLFELSRYDTINKPQSQCMAILICFRKAQWPIHGNLVAGDAVYLCMFWSLGAPLQVR